MNPVRLTPAGRPSRTLAIASAGALASAIAALVACQVDRPTAMPPASTTVEPVVDAAPPAEPVPAAAPRTAPESTAPSAPAPAGQVHRARTADGRWDVEWSATPAIAFNEAFELECRVTDPSGVPADGVQLSTTVWMPAHKHGSVRQTKTIPLGDGRYRVTGLLLHMEGHWELFVDIGFDGQFGRATFDVLLAPEEADGSYAEFSVDEVSRVLALSPLPEPPDDPTNAYDLDERAARLGQFLFFDARLSGSGKTSCATCHVPERNWSDGRALAVAEEALPRRTMPLWNVAYQRWWFWDGRADSLWAQALQPLEDPREMAGSRVAIARLLHADADLRRAYTAVFGEPPDVTDAARFPAAAKPVAADPEGDAARAWTAMAEADRAAVDRVFANVGKAIAAFQRQIVSRSSPFDDFVEGLRQGDAERMAAFGPAARRGLKLYLGRANCHFCHSGPNFTDREFHNNRAPSRSELPIDLGRFAGMVRLQTDPFNALGPHADGDDAESRAKLEHMPVDGHRWGEFRTPTLRGVADGGPYMHQGQFETLAQVVDFYSDQVSGFTSHGDYDPVLQPVKLSAEEKSDLIEFLRTLSSGQVPEPLLRQPASPCLE